MAAGSVAVVMVSTGSATGSPYLKIDFRDGGKGLNLKRLMGVEPTSQAWEAWVMPLYNSRLNTFLVYPIYKTQVKPFNIHRNQFSDIDVPGC